MPTNTDISWLLIRQGFQRLIRERVVDVLNETEYVRRWVRATCLLLLLLGSCEYRGFPNRHTGRFSFQDREGVLRSRDLQSNKKPTVFVSYAQHANQGFSISESKDK